MYSSSKNLRSLRGMVAFLADGKSKFQEVHAFTQLFKINIRKDIFVAEH